MKQESRELLLKDLCGRLPYGVKIEVVENDDFSSIEVLDCYYLDKLDNKFYKIKPYLFPPQSLPQAQKDEICKVADGMEHGSCAERWDAMIKFVDLLNKYKVDYRDLIPNGLAKDATGLNLYEK